MAFGGIGARMAVRVSLSDWLALGARLLGV